MLEAARENRPGRHRGQARRAARTNRAAAASGSRSRSSSEQEFVIGGFTEPQGERDYFGALVLGVYEDGELRWVGNVGTGFDQKLLAGIYARLKPLITEECPFAERPKPDSGMTWVKPELVCQVKYANWTPDDRLRAPVFLGLRNDVARAARWRARKPGAAPNPPVNCCAGRQRSDAARSTATR